MFLLVIRQAPTDPLSILSAASRAGGGAPSPTPGLPPRAPPPIAPKPSFGAVAPPAAVPQTQPGAKKEDDPFAAFGLKKRTH